MATTKKDIDKEKMFNKIMPSGAKKSGPSKDLSKRFEDPIHNRRYSEIPSEPEVEPDDEYSEIDEYVQRVNNQQGASKGKPSKADLINMANEYIEDSTAAQKAGIHTAFEDSKRTVMVNIREKMVLAKLDAAFEKFNCCSCYCCKQDVTAMTLNNLKPKYVIAAIDDIDKIIAKEDFTEITSAIMKAILEVKKHPRH
ncbi:MAG: hypothetical protein E7509_01650 [Ruminococcus sp.]|nr:hypothetical protein [Ruminococcus sp.]